jgi:hypothetical protein
VSRIQLGSVLLLVPEHGVRDADVTDFGGVTHSAREWPAVVVGPGGLLAEIAYQRWDEGGKVVMLSRGDSAPSYDRLMHGERLGIKVLDDGTEFVEADLLRWDPAKRWGGSTMATPDELDATLGSSAEALLVEAGGLAFGKRAEVFGDTSKRRNRLCVTFPAGEAVGPLAVYVLTRILPILDTEVPSSATAGQIISGTITMLRVFGWELGERYDGTMRRKVGDEWLEKLRQVRRAQHPDLPLYKKPLNLHDPQFAVNEPLRNDDSPLRTLLPAMTLEFYDRFKRIPALRNREQHFDQLPSMQTLREDAELIGWVAARIGLPMAESCAAMVARVDEIQAGHQLAPNVGAELMHQVAEEQEKARMLAEEVAHLRARQREQRETNHHEVEAKARLEAQLQAAEAARALAEDKLRAAQAALEVDAARRRSVQSRVEGLTPGDPWSEAPPARALRLLPHVEDLYDSRAADLLSNQVGRSAVSACRRWRDYLPHGGTVHLSDAGQAVALVDGAWTYLGDLDEVQR